MTNPCKLTRDPSRTVTVTGLYSSVLGLDVTATLAYSVATSVLCIVTFHLPGFINEYGYIIIDYRRMVRDIQPKIHYQGNL